jgi:hypothetical protein
MLGAITTLFEKDYHYGVAALANSLVASGFEGTFWAGYRGEIPPWAKGETLDGGQTRIVLSPKAEMRLMPLDTPLHFAHYKPWFMISVLEQLDPKAEAVFYFDPDIIVPTRWSYYEEWTGYGVAMVEDNHYHVGPDHPLRHAWKAFAQEKNIVVRRDLSRFVNSGFLGVKPSQELFVSVGRTHHLRGIGERQPECLAEPRPYAPFLECESGHSERRCHDHGASCRHLRTERHGFRA